MRPQQALGGAIDTDPWPCRKCHDSFPGRAVGQAHKRLCTGEPGQPGAMTAEQIAAHIASTAASTPTLAQSASNDSTVAALLEALQGGERSARSSCHEANTCSAASRTYAAGSVAIARSLISAAAGTGGAAVSTSAAAGTSSVAVSTSDAVHAGSAQTSALECASLAVDLVEAMEESDDEGWQICDGARRARGHAVVTLPNPAEMNRWAALASQ